MKIEKRGAGWWITGTPPYMVDDEGPHTDYGPYGTKADAEQTIRRVNKTLKKLPNMDEEKNGCLLHGCAPRSRQLTLLD